MKAIKRRYLSAKKKLVAAQQSLEEARIAMQLECLHENTAEFPHESDPYLHHHRPPYRVCADCGFAEYGWSCGYMILTNKPNIAEAERIGNIHENYLFVIPYNWKDSGRKPRTVKEVYKMVVMGKLPKDYLDNK